MSLEASVRLILGRLRLEAEVAVATGELVVLLVVSVVVLAALRDRWVDAR